MKVTPRQRETVRRAAGALGLEKPLGRLYERLEPAAHRDRIDNEHMRLLMAFWLPEDANCIDIGAHSGTILSEIVRCAPGGRHIAYEPLPEFAERLRREFPTVEVRNAAVSNVAGTESFFKVVDDPMQSGLKRRTGADPQASEPITVQVDRLDDALAEDYVPTLIKIDVEGGERQVLEGAMETITRHSPVVCFEHGPGAEREYDTSPGPVFDLLVTDAGLRIFDIDGNGPYTRSRFVDTYQKPIWNFVAHR
jgi:FkbM family methyltransferase